MRNSLHTFGVEMGLVRELPSYKRHREGDQAPKALETLSVEGREATHRTNHESIKNNKRLNDRWKQHCERLLWRSLASDALEGPPSPDSPDTPMKGASSVCEAESAPVGPDPYEPLSTSME